MAPPVRQLMYAQPQNPEDLATDTINSKPGKDPGKGPFRGKRPISLICHSYTLFERLILNRLASQEQAGFRPGKSTTSQLHLTQHIEDGFQMQRGQITGAFVDLSAAYDTVNHRRILAKVLEMTRDVHLTKLLQTLLQNRSFSVEQRRGGKRSRWRR